MASVGVGIVTYQRPDFYRACANSVLKHLGWARWLGAYHDGEDAGGYEASPIPLTFGLENRGVAFAKNWLLRAMLSAEVDWLCLLEDDMAVTSPMAVLGYVEACQESGFEHLGFHGHGYWRPPVGTDLSGAVEFYANYAGCWSVTSRHAIEVAGLLDPTFRNSWEHVEWSLRMAEHGFTSPWRQAADAVGAEHWLREQPGAHDQSIIARLPDTGRNAELGREHWKRTHPETWPAELG